MRKNKLKELFKKNIPIINTWLAIPSSFSAEVMANQGWDSVTIDMQHGLIDYSNAVNMLQAISTTNTIPLARVNWNEPGQIMKILDAGSYGIICPMVSNRKEAENFVQACQYPPRGYRSFGPIRASIYGGSDYAKHADKDILTLAMIETKDSLEKLVPSSSSFSAITYKTCSPTGKVMDEVIEKSPEILNTCAPPNSIFPRLVKV